jgi:hypothetical protein
MIKRLLLAIAIMFTSSTLYAEGNNTAKADNNKSAAVKADKLEPAYKLLEAMNLKSVYIGAVDGYAKRLVKANTNFKSIEGKIKDFYQKYVSWDIMKKDLAKLYSSYYNEKELNDITNFYKTDTGKKVLATMGKVAYEGQMLTQKRLKPHLNELKSLLDSAIKKAKDKEAKAKEKESKK